MCTGSGAVAIAVYKELEKNKRKVSVTASDVSEDALALAKENAEENGADIAFVQSDLFSRLRGRYNIIVSNPPYIPTGDIAGLQREVRDFEPSPWRWTAARTGWIFTAASPRKRVNISSAAECSSWRSASGRRKAW